MPDNTRAEFHCTIVSLSESPRDPKMIWAGTDDGNVQITRDGGTTWTNVAKNIPGRLPSPWVKSIQASWKDAGTAYVAIDQHRQDDFGPHAFMTTDYGKTWKDISAGLNGYVHIVMEDPKEPSLLYAGTELGIFASFDRGESLDRPAARRAAHFRAGYQGSSARERSDHRHPRRRLLHSRRRDAAAAAGAGDEPENRRSSRPCAPPGMFRPATRASWEMPCGSHATSPTAPSFPTTYPALPQGRSNSTILDSGGEDAADTRRHRECRA